MKTRTEEIIAYQRSYWGCTMYDAIMAVADVSDLDNDELDELEDELCNGVAYSQAVSQTYPKQGEIV